MKVFFSQNLILSTIKMFRYAQKNEIGQSRKIFDNFEKISKSVLTYQLLKYP
jgi:hypothetical protein